MIFVSNSAMLLAMLLLSLQPTLSACNAHERLVDERSNLRIYRRSGANPMWDIEEIRHLVSLLEEGGLFPLRVRVNRNHSLAIELVNRADYRVSSSDKEYYLSHGRRIVLVRESDTYLMFGIPPHGTLESTQAR